MKLKKESQKDGTIIYSFVYKGEKYAHQYPKSKPIEEVEKIAKLTIEYIDKKYEQNI